MRCAIWYHLYNLKNVKNTHGGVLILVKLQASAFFLSCFNFFQQESMSVNISSHHFAMPQKMLGIVAKFRV